jgi:hypothetical protein
VFESDALAACQHYQRAANAQVSDRRNKCNANCNDCRRRKSWPDVAVRHRCAHVAHWYNVAARHRYRYRCEHRLCATVGRVSCQRERGAPLAASAAGGIGGGAARYGSRCRLATSRIPQNQSTPDDGRPPPRPSPRSCSSPFVCLGATRRGEARADDGAATISGIG